MESHGAKSPEEGSRITPAGMQNTNLALDGIGRMRHAIAPTDWTGLTHGVASHIRCDRLRIMPIRALLEGVAGAQHQRVLPPAPDDLHPHRQAVCEAAGNGERGHAEHVERES